MAEVTPEQQAQIDELSRQVGGGLGGKMGDQLAKGVAKTATNEVKTLNTMNGQGQDSKFMYGGWAGGAHEAASRYRNQADAAQGRQGAQINYGAADGTRGSALSMAGLMAARARGETPSIAGMMADRQMGQAAAEQSSAAASARGPAALALSQQGAAANTAAMQSNISGQAQINGANERMQAEQAAFGAYSGTSAQDASRAQAQGQLDAAKQQQNDAMTLGMTGFETGVQTAQMNGGMALVGQQAAGAANYANMVANRKAAANAKDGQLLQAGATTAGTAAMFMSDEDTKVPAPSTWGTTQAAPAAPATWGTGPGTDPVDHAAAQARDALDQQQVREMTPTGPSGGFGSVEHGIGALKRRNEEDLGLLQSKERLGIKPTKKESVMRSVMERRARLDAGQPEGGPVAKAAARAPAAAADKPNAGERVGSGLMQLGRVFGSAPAPAAQPMMQAPSVNIAAPTALSDDKTKLAAAWDKGHSAALANVEERSRESAGELADADKGGSEAAAAVRGIKARTWDEAAKAGERDVFRARIDARATESNADMDRRNAEMFARMAADRPVEDPNAPFSEPQPATARPVGAQFSQSGDPQSRRSPVEFTREGGAAVPAPVAAAPSGGFYPMASRMRAMVSDEKTKDIAEISAEHDGGSDRPSVGSLGKQIPHQDMAEFARSMRGVPYAYKPEFASREGQAPGEVNIGPVAQEMEKSKVGATIVKPDPAGSGMRTLDQPKMVKGLGAVVADQQDQLDEMRSMMARRFGGGRR